MSQLCMVNEPKLIKHLRKTARRTDGGYLSLEDVRQSVSNPRIRGFYVRNADTTELLLTGVSALPEISRLADDRRRTFALSPAQWAEKKGVFDFVERRYRFSDPTVSKIQLWHCDPFPVSFEHIRWLLALAVSFTNEELAQCERACGLLNQQLIPYGFAFDDC